MISERPAEADDRAVPGHWEGDLITGSGNRSAIGTLVERSTRYVMLVYLDGDHKAETVQHALVKAIQTLPVVLRRSLTWDQGTEMANHLLITQATDMPIYFCDPHSPWQRGSNENTNGLLRQYFPKGTDLSQWSPEHLEYVANELNNRPRATLGYLTPNEVLAMKLGLPVVLPPGYTGPRDLPLAPPPQTNPHHHTSTIPHTTSCSPTATNNPTTCNQRSVLTHACSWLATHEPNATSTHPTHPTSSGIPPPHQFPHQPKPTRL
jgi:hypothetical protein